MENKLKLARLKAERRKAKQDASDTILRRLEEAVSKLDNHTVEVDTTGIEKILSEFEVTPTFQAGDITVETEIFSKKIDEVKALVAEKKIREPSEIKRPLEELVETLKLKPSQDPSNFIPYRRVILDGRKLRFDDSLPSSHSGGGGGATIEELRTLLRTYGIARLDDASDTEYYGFEDDNSNWYVLRNQGVLGVWQYASGTGGIDAQWAGRAGLQYVDKGAAF